MISNCNIAVIGGDIRQAYLINKLVQENYIVKICGIENTPVYINGAVICNDCADALQNADYVILGVPYTKDNTNIYTPLSDKTITIDEVNSCINKKAIILAGRIKNSHFINKTIDYASGDEFAYLNAIPTAEGCINTIIDNSEKCIDSMKILITGYGRVAKILAYKLKALNAEVTICARNKTQLAQALGYGFNVCPINKLNDSAILFDTYINTVDANIFNKDFIDLITDGKLIIDLASFPGGTDFSYAAKKKIKAIHALSLPAKTAPETAGEIIFKVVNDMIKEDIT